MLAWRTPRGWAAGAVLVLLLSAAAAAQQPAQNVAPASAAPPAPASQYVGSETCKGCHEDIYKSVEGTLHVRTFKAKDAAHQGCEGCHGPGAAHVEGGGDPSKIFRFQKVSMQQANARCLTCHAQQHERQFFQNSKHARSDVGCTSCHSPHHFEVRDRLLKQPTPQLCYGCHTEIRAEFVRPFHHRVDEGLVTCNDCHNPHGGTLAKDTRMTPSLDQVCTKCHADKRGPFTFEHVPVKTEGCTACHVPHGSTSPRMLKRTSVNVLCLECHS